MCGSVLASEGKHILYSWSKLICGLNGYILALQFLLLVAIM